MTMKRFILTRKITHTERAVVESESWDDAKAMLRSDETDFEIQADDDIEDETIEYIGD